MSGHGSTGGLLTVFLCGPAQMARLFFFGYMKRERCFVFFHLSVFIIVWRGSIARTIVNEENAFGGGGWDVGGLSVVLRS